MGLVSTKHTDNALKNKIQVPTAYKYNFSSLD